MTFISNASTNSPVIDYSSRDYASIYLDIVSRIPSYLPEWTTQSPNDFGIVLVQLFAYVGDLLGYYLDRLASESFIQTATQATSVENLAAMLDYTPGLSTGATVTLQITISPSVTGPYTIPAGTQFSTLGSSTQQPIIFFTTAPLTIAGSSGPTPSQVGQVAAQQGIVITSEQVATSDGTINQIYPLQNGPVESSSFSVFVNLGQGPVEWIYTGNLIDNGPLAQVYTNYVDANGVFYIEFGDGVSGYVPPLGSPITCTYTVGAGSLGNVGSGTIIDPVTGLVGVVGVTNPLPANGGQDAESLASIQQAAPASLKTLNRGITVADIETLAQSVSGVQWASALEVTYQLVSLYISPTTGGNPTSVLLAAIENFLFPLMLANTTVTLLNPTYVPINITISILAVEPNAGNTATETLVLASLTSLLSLVNTGFGFRVSLGSIYSAILDQSGVNYAIVTNVYRQQLCFLTSALSAGTPYTNLIVSPLPQAINTGDSIILNPGGTPTVTATASGPALVGAVNIGVNSFTPVNNYALGTAIQDPNAGAVDAVLLSNEIPTAGTFTISQVTGGMAGS